MKKQLLLTALMAITTFSAQAAAEFANAMLSIATSRMFTATIETLVANNETLVHSFQDTVPTLMKTAATGTTKAIASTVFSEPKQPSITEKVIGAAVLAVIGYYTVNIFTKRDPARP